MKRFLVLVAAVALVAAACGGDDDAQDTTATQATTTAPSATTSAPAPTITAAPTTTVAAAATTTTATPTDIVAGEDPDVDAVVLAYSVAFDSESEFDAKAAYIDDPSGLEDTVAAYLTTGESMGGIGVSATAVTVNGDTADVTYDLLFGGNPTYPDLAGTAVLTEEGWKVPRTVFCSLMSSARVGCP